MPRRRTCIEPTDGKLIVRDGTLFVLMGSFALSGAAALAAISWASRR